MSGSIFDDSQCPMPAVPSNLADDVLGCTNEITVDVQLLAAARLHVEPQAPGEWLRLGRRRGTIPGSARARCRRFIGIRPEVGWKEVDP